MNQRIPVLLLAAVTGCSAGGSRLLADGQLAAPNVHGPVGPVTYTNAAGVSFTPQSVSGEVLVLAKPGTSRSAITGALTHAADVRLEAALPAANLYLFQVSPGGEAALIAAASGDSDVLLATPNLLNMGSLNGECTGSGLMPTMMNSTTNLEGAFSCSQQRPGNVRTVAIDLFRNQAINASPCVSHGQEVSCILSDAAQDGGPICAIDIDDGITSTGSATQFDIDLALAAALNSAADSANQTPPGFTVVNMSLQNQCRSGPIGLTGQAPIDGPCTREGERNLIRHIAGIIKAEINVSGKRSFAVVLAAGNSTVDLTSVLADLRADPAYAEGTGYILPVVATDKQTNRTASYSNFSQHSGDAINAVGDSSCSGFPVRGTSFAAPKVADVLASAIANFQAHSPMTVRGSDAISAMFQAAPMVTTTNLPTPAQVLAQLQAITKMPGSGGGGCICGPMNVSCTGVPQSQLLQVCGGFCGLSGNDCHHDADCGPPGSGDGCITNPCGCPVGQ